MTKRKIFQWIATLLCVTTFLPCVACSDEEESSSSSTPTVEVVEGSYIYKGGVSEYSILVRDDANYYENFAATELAQNFSKSTGNSISIVTESELKDSKHVISLGHTSLWDANVNVSLSTSDIIESGYYIKTVDNNIYISCPDNTSSSGVLYGVYELLNDAIGYEFFAVDEVYYETKRDIPLYDYSGYVVNPSFEMRMIRNADLRDDNLTVMRYRMSYPSSNFGMVTWGHGQVSQYVLPDARCTCGAADCTEGLTHQQHHPDWFSNYGTKNIQLCWSAGDVLETVTANKFIQYFQQYPNAEYFMFGQEDSISYCDCDRCVQAMADYACNPAGLQIAFMNNVIEKTTAWLKENQPGRQVKYVIYAYYGTEGAPVKTAADGSVVPYSNAVDPVDNLYIFYTPIGANFAFQIDSTINADVYKNLSEWSVIADGQLIMYLYDINFHHYLINFNNFGTVRGMYETCKDLGVACIMTQAADSYTTCFQEMRSYVESNLMWDVQLSYDDLVHKFMDAYYKDAADYIYEYYQILRDRYAYYQTIVSPESGGIYGELQNSILWTQPIIEKIDMNFDKALQSIAKYENSDPALYKTLHDRIMKERMSSMYLKISILASYYSETERAEIKAELRHYIEYFKLSELKEGSDFGDLMD